MSSDPCAQANELANSVIFRTVLISTIIISAVAIVLEIWIMLKTTNRILLHQNTRILIIAHQLWLISYCIAKIFAQTYILITFHKTSVDGCEYMLFPWECFMTRAPTILTSFLNGFSIQVIVIERVIATYFSSKYEKFGKNIAVILISIQVFIAIVSFLYAASNFPVFDSEKMAYCSRAQGKESSRLVMVLIVHVITSVISAFIFPVLLIVNKKFYRSKVYVSLSQRYQIMENMNSIRTLLPMVTIYSLLLVMSLLAVFVYVYFGFNVSLKSAIYLECVQQTPLYALTLPIVIMWTEKYVKKSHQQSQQKAMAMDFKGDEAAEYYFAFLKTTEEMNI